MKHTNWIMFNGTNKKKKKKKRASLPLSLFFLFHREHGVRIVVMEAKTKMWHSAIYCGNWTGAVIMWTWTWWSVFYQMWAPVWNRQEKALGFLFETSSEVESGDASCWILRWAGNTCSHSCQICSASTNGVKPRATLICTTLVMLVQE